MGLLDYTDELVDTIEAWDGTIGAPSARNRKTNRIRVFKNRFIEDVFATSHPIMPGVWFGPVIGYGLYAAVTSADFGAVMGLALFAVGVLVWTLMEYSLHRWAFHWTPNLDRFDSKLRLFMLHGYHHEFPNDKWRLVAPPVLSWPIAAVTAAFYGLVAGPTFFWPLFAGTVAGYVAYDWTHYATHHFKPRTGFGKMVRRAHMVHHFKVFHLNMGISSPLWDFVLGSYAWSDDAVRDAVAEAKALDAAQG